VKNDDIPWTARKTNAEILIEAIKTKTNYCRPEEKTSKSCSSKGETGGHHDNTQNICKTRPRKTIRKDVGQIDRIDGDENCN
jgi:hypothetical protein